MVMLAGQWCSVWRTRRPALVRPRALGWRALAMLLGVLVVALPVQARDLKASVAYIPKLSESSEQGPFIDLLKAIDRVYKAGRIEIRVYPFARSIQNVVTGEADFHMPMLRSPHFSAQDHPFRFMGKPMGKVCLVIYSHRDSPVTVDQLYAHQDTRPYPYEVSIMRGSAQFLDLPVKEVSEIQRGLRQVAARRTDAFLGAQEEADLILRKSGLTQIHRNPFRCYDDVFILPKGEQGWETEKILTQALVTLEVEGRLQTLHGKVHQPYQDWQLYDQQTEK